MGTLTDCSGLPRLVLAGPFRLWWPWVAADPEWVANFELQARVRYGEDLRRDEGPGRLAYALALPVIGRDDSTPVRVEFSRYPGYVTYGLAPIDYPRVFADEGARSPHRMPDDSLCLFDPRDGENRRWTAEKGLDELLLLTARHLFAEDYWRQMGEVWPFDEAPHGDRGAA